MIKSTIDDKIKKAKLVKMQYRTDHVTGNVRPKRYYKSMFNSHCPYGILFDYLNSEEGPESFVKKFEMYKIDKKAEKAKNNKSDVDIDIDSIYDKAVEFYMSSDYIVKLDCKTRFILLAIAKKKGICFNVMLSRILKDFIKKESVILTTKE